ncbi:MAG: hypothetical protein ACHQCH_05155 [Solirubrobacterales bacterium]
MSLVFARSTYTKAAILSTEPIASSSPTAGAAGPCTGCGAPLAADQRYCLECGERSTPMSSVLLGSPPVSGDSQQPTATAPPPAQGAPAATDARQQQRNTVNIIAGVGVLLLAMGVGVLIGRAGNSKPAAAAVQTISVAQPGAATGGVGSSTAPATPAGETPETPAKSGSSSAKKGAAGAGAAKGGGGKKAAASTPKSSSPNSGKSYEEKSKNLPNVVETH